MGNFQDISGQTFHQLTVLRRAHNSCENTVQFYCKCSCGKECVVRSSFLKNGHTKSCGCHKIDLVSKRNKANSTHGHCRDGNSSTYQIWANIWYRCTNPNVKHYASYGGKGIKVCERWKVFENFLADMGEHPVGLSIDRIDNDGDYCPENCRWATPQQQQRNRSNNRFVEHEGKIKCIAELVEGCSINAAAVRSRIVRGWSVKDAISKPVL